jgi:hypothetical protein
VAVVVVGELEATAGEGSPPKKMFVVEVGEGVRELGAGALTGCDPGDNADWDGRFGAGLRLMLL